MNTKCESEIQITVLYYCVVALFLSAFFLFIFVCVQLEKIDQLLMQFDMFKEEKKSRPHDLYVPLTII